MTRDAAVLSTVKLFTKERDIDESKVIRSVQALLDTRIRGEELSFDEKERERDQRIAQLEPMTADELEVVRDSIRVLERIAPD
jgi:hypothetical protein